MQQAYRAVRVVAETQTIRIVLNTQLDELAVQELITVCMSLQADVSNGIKALVLDFPALASHKTQSDVSFEEALTEAQQAIETVPAVVIAVLHGPISTEVCTLIQAADLTLAANEATICVPATKPGEETEIVTGKEAERLGLVNQAVAESQMKTELARILDLLRAKSAVALQLAKAAQRLVRNSQTSRLETLKQVNDFYLTRTMKTEDASEGLHAFLEKREPVWKNR